MDTLRPPSQRTPLTPMTPKSRGTSSTRGGAITPVGQFTAENNRKLRKLRSSELLKGLPGYMAPLMSKIPGEKSKKVIKQKKAFMSPKGIATPRD